MGTSEDGDRQEGSQDNMELTEDQDKHNKSDRQDDKDDSASKDTDSSSMFVTAFPHQPLYPSLPPVDTVDGVGQSPVKETASSSQSATNSTPTSNKTSSSHRRKGPASRRVVTDKQSTEVQGTDTTSHKSRQDAPSLAKLLSSREPKQPLESDASLKEVDSSLASLLELPTTSQVPVSMVMEAYKYGMQKGLKLGTSSHNTEQASSKDTDASSFLTALVEQKSMEQVLSVIPVSRVTPTDHPLGTGYKNGSANVRSDKELSPRSTHLGKRPTTIQQEHPSAPIPGSVLPPSKRSRPSFPPAERRAVSELGRPSLGASVKNIEATRSNHASHHSKSRGNRQSPRIKVVEGAARPKHSRSSSLDSVASGLAAMLAQPVASIVGSKERQRSSMDSEGDIRGGHATRPAGGDEQKRTDSPSTSKKKKQQSWIANLFNP